MAARKKARSAPPARAPVSQPLPVASGALKPDGYAFDGASGRWSAAIVCAVLVLLTVATYTPVWRFDFVAIDDPQYVYANPHLANGLTAQTITWAFRAVHEANWHPLTWLSHALDIQLFGLAPGPHHVTNLVLHLANTLLLFGLMRMLTRSLWKSSVVAALFAVHPLHVESVAWVAERKDVLCAFFFMLTVGAYVRYVRAPSVGRYLLVAIGLALGLMAKPMIVTLPMVLLLIDYWPLDRFRRGFGALVLEKLPLFAIVGASSLVTFLAQKQGGAVKTLSQMPLALRVQNAIVSYVDYLAQTIWPVNMGVFYPFPRSLSAASVAVAALILVGITVAVWVLRRRAPYMVVGWLWFLGMLVPVSGIAEVGAQARADRFMYLPMIGLTVAVVWGLAELARNRTAMRGLAAAAVVAVAACAGVAHAQVQYWRDTVALWSHTAQATEKLENFGVYFSLAEYLRTTNRPLEAIPQYEASLARNPAYTDARQGLVRVLLDTKQQARAEMVLEDWVRARPDDADAQIMLGSLLVDLDRGRSAEPHLVDAIRLRPENAEAHWRLALVRAAESRLVEALPDFAEAVRLNPSSAPMRNDYGWALAQHGQVAAGIAQIEQALALKADFVDAHHNLGRLFASQGKLDEALSHLKEAVRLEPGYVDARLTLAITLIRAGRTDDGVKELREVLARDPGNEAARRALAAIGR
jgi:tetratricopeptide (TPR) repeat protein